MIADQIVESALLAVKEGIPIQLGSVFINKSYRYLYPTLKLYKNGVHDVVRQIHKLGVGVGDVIYYNDGNPILTSELFILADTKGAYSNGLHVVPEEAQRNFDKSLQWLKGSGCLTTDYVFDDINGHLHMLVIRVPDDTPHAVRAFLMGKYEYIFTKDQALRLFNQKEDTYKVVTNDHDYRIKLSDYIARRIGKNVEPDELAGLSSKPNFEKEMFKSRKVLTGKAAIHRIENVKT